MREAKHETLLKIQLEMGQLRYVLQKQAEEIQSWRSWYSSVCTGAQQVHGKFANNQFVSICSDSVKDEDRDDLETKDFIMDEGDMGVQVVTTAFQSASDDLELAFEGALGVELEKGQVVQASPPGEDGCFCSECCGGRGVGFRGVIRE